MIGLALAVIGLYALLSGHLTEKSFIHILEMVWNRITWIFRRPMSNTATAINAGEGSDASRGDNDDSSELS